MTYEIHYFILTSNVKYTNEKSAFFKQFFLAISWPTTAWCSYSVQRLRSLVQLPGQHMLSWLTKTQVTQSNNKIVHVNKIVLDFVSMLVEPL